MNDPGEIRKALETARTIAVVGCSPRPDRPSHAIARYLLEQGYRVIPVNPGHQTILGETCYRSLDEIPEEVEIDIVDVFRRSNQVDPDAARRLEAAGIPVAMDRCILVEHASRALSPRNFEARVER